MVDISLATAKRAVAARPRKPAKNGKKRRGGRLTEDRQREIVALVAPLFIERGYERVTIDDIVAVIGGSKRTLYERFGGKAGLFEIVISEYCASVQRDLFAAVDPDASPEKQLVALGTHFLSMILHRRILWQHRLLVSMGSNFPKVATLFYQLGPKTAYALVAKWIRQQQQAGAVRAGDPVLLAELFLDMLTGKHQLALLTSSFEETSDAAIKRTVKEAARVFLHGVAT